MPAVSIRHRCEAGAAAYGLAERKAVRARRDCTKRTYTKKDLPKKDLHKVVTALQRALAR